MPKVRFEPASIQDLDTLVALRMDAMRESLERIGRFDARRARERFAASFDPSLTHHIVHQGQRVGFVVLRPTHPEWLLDHLYIHPAHQGQGLGSEVLAWVFQQADANGAALRVGALRESDSNRFYQRHGFRLVEQAEWDNYYLREAAPC